MSSSISASSTSSATASATSSVSSSSSTSSNLKVVGIILAVVSGFLIGSSFVFKKKGLLRSQAGCVAGQGVAYLKSPLWWIGMTMMILGELCNSAAYAFIEAIVVTPLGALSVVICAILSSIFLKETLTIFGWLGCALCILGSVVIALNGPQEALVGQITEFQKLFLSPGFLVYISVLIAASLVIIFFFAPKYGTKSMLWYIFVCSMIGGISVSVTTGVGAAVVETAKGDNQFKHWFMYFLIGFVAVTLITEVYYLNKALALFNTAMVTPTYYVIFTFFSMVTTVVLFKGLDSSASEIITIVMGFLVICIGITILQMSKVDPTHLSKLDRRSTLLLQAARSQTEVEEKGAIGSEDPGMDALRGSFGAMGSIIRARSARRVSEANRASSYRTRPPGAAAPYDPEQSRQQWPEANNTTPSTAFDLLSGVKRHQLYDAPVPRTNTGDSESSGAGATRGDDSSSIKSPSLTDSHITNKRPTIKFGSQDLVHQYHPTGNGQRDDQAATHEHRLALGIPGIVMPGGGSGSGYPPAVRTQPLETTIDSKPDLFAESPTSYVNSNSMREQSVPVPPGYIHEHTVHSAPPSMNPRLARSGQQRVDSRDIFGDNNSPSTATLLSFPSVTDSARSWDGDEVDETGTRGRSSKKYPKGR
ncbi:magnesium transporter NIPA-domain-containing protein [Desarmillaria tabescens]|uniref:Magnesium transporter NIPA-domain-containing protein n=1 Tax=Armillaria tabescens TaxID=1929756 RepID=A0AA39NBG6_ARMTA|nr:magnesium transporter NIPA-domain-containing protein [Desarmillaria tabescens]KAK0462546.1 magnesium transporter NIPA-domain-containing protein [Desarmillaria tabescens]